MPAGPGLQPDPPGPQDPELSQFIGLSPAFAHARALIRRFAGCTATILLQGETGTGKELAARAIHYLSDRQGFPFIPVNCGALPDSLVENELFGHVRGAFTDARDTQAGLVATAEGGTLFLDEIEALSPKAQVVLLRFLQDRTYRPLGARAPCLSNVRIVAASNAALADLVKSGMFRQDLLYRLAVLAIHLPPLRERPGDAILLARHFIAHFARQYKRPAAELTPASMEALDAYTWPGNVRELETLIHRAFLLADGAALEIRPPTAAGPAPTASEGGRAAGHFPFELGFRRAKAMVVAEFEREFVVRALATSGGNVSAAARLIGKERRAFGRLLRKYSIDRAAFC
ncbi:MAG TPA: sigma-54 dependent transcriptional regulator [Vicinamibacteria bacterium]